jgi:hypothetical protein
MFWFTKKIKMRCCFCASQICIPPEVTNCPKCLEPVPDCCKDFPDSQPFFVPMIGWSNVGKTVWLMSVIRRLTELSSTVWREFTPIPGPEITHRLFDEVEKLISTRGLPGATPKEQVPPAHVFVLKNTPLWGNRTFVFRDCPGEAFANLQIAESQLAFLLKAPVTFFMFSVPDLVQENRYASSMEALLRTYTKALREKNVDLLQQRRRFVVVLSKCDAIRGEMPSNLYSYLERDPVVELSQTGRRNDFSEESMVNYLEELGRASDAIREWLESIRQGKQFVNLAKVYNIELRFSAISALGGPAESGRLQQPWTPYRVLDPIFWALELHSRTPPPR